MATLITNPQNQTQPSTTTTTTNHHASLDHHHVAAITVPFPAQGHLNQLLQLSCLVSSYGIPVYYVAPPVFSRQARSRANGLNPLDLPKIHFHDIPTPHVDSPPPNPDLPYKFPTQLLPAWYASLTLREPFSAFLLDLSKKFKRVVVIHDPMMAFVVQDVDSVPNAESYIFNCISAASHISFLWPSLAKPVSVEYPKELPLFERCMPEEVNRFVSLQTDHLDRRSGDIYNTCRLLEAPYLDILEHEEISGKAKKRKSWAVGPMLPAVLSPRAEDEAEERNECLRWLDRHEPKSVVYVSFGTTVSLTDEQLGEIAVGLERSGAKFLWVVRDADTCDVFGGTGRRPSPPEGFEERVEGRGMVMRGWAPQPWILAHGAVGGFVSHCGWNSCVESIVAGVPVAAWPMHSDQPANTALLVRVLGMGIVVMEWAGQAGLVRAEAVEDAVRRLMGPGEGERVRRRAEEVGKMVREAANEGGSSRLEMDSFIAHISRQAEEGEI
ncbi:UDP-glucose glucosyltransferase [Striga asiatica]|uniref:Glycosyltransferase n=1 Tax=Striga asiatica TaxID=4170 RepID=A0A5A7RJ26_STRAF|nr:UDP-glucose glucosyltransferase [Striga asiatica]